MKKNEFGLAQGELRVRSMMNAKANENQPVNLAEIFGSRGVDVTGVDM